MAMIKGRIGFRGAAKALASHPDPAKKGKNRQEEANTITTGRSMREGCATNHPEKARITRQPLRLDTGDTPSLQTIQTEQAHGSRPKPDYTPW